MFQVEVHETLPWDYLGVHIVLDDMLRYCKDVDAIGSGDGEEVLEVVRILHPNCTIGDGEEGSSSWEVEVGIRVTRDGLYEGCLTPAMPLTSHCSSSAPLSGNILAVVDAAAIRFA